MTDTITRNPAGGDDTHRCNSSDEGVVAIEFVLIVPIILLLVFGIIEFGRAYNAKVELTAAVREGVRELALGESDGIAATIAAAPGLDAGAIVVTTSGSPCTAGTPATVTANYPVEIGIPFWGDATLDIEAEGVMRCGG